MYDGGEEGRKHVPTPARDSLDLGIGEPTSRFHSID